MRTISLLFLLKLSLLTTCGGQSAPPKEIGSPCVADDTCVEGATCYLERCRQFCSTTSDCEPFEVSHHSDVCILADVFECRSDEDCTFANDCLLQEGAECYGGGCRFLSKAFGTACEDRNDCTVEDACDGEGHCLGKPIPCAPTTISGDVPMGDVRIPIVTCPARTAATTAWSPVTALSATTARVAAK